MAEKMKTSEEVEQALMKKTRKYKELKTKQANLAIKNFDSRMKRLVEKRLFERRIYQALLISKQK